jgi:hypothetical protein
MNRELISERNDTQEPAVQVGHSRPEAKAIVFLRLAAKRMLHNPDAHLFREIRPAREDILLEVALEFELRHVRKIQLFGLQEQPVGCSKRHRISGWSAACRFGLDKEPAAV